MTRTRSVGAAPQVGAGGDAAATAELVEVLTSACETAQRERTALQQILDTKVRRAEHTSCRGARLRGHSPEGMSRLIRNKRATEAEAPTRSRCPARRSSA